VFRIPVHDLLKLYSRAAARLASSTDTPAWEDDDDAPRYRSIFRRGNLPSPPAELSTNGMYIRRGTHTYPSLAVDSVHLFATPGVYRCLGLWIVACLLEPGCNEFWLQVTHAGSEVRHICVDTRYRSLDDEGEGLHTQPHAAVYYPGVVGAFPLADQPPPLPSLRLTDRAQRVAGFGDDDDRDTIQGFGSDIGAWRFAEVLLNLSQPWSKRVEVNLEGPSGFGGAAPDSAEVRFWLPGSDGWNPDEWAESPAG
jgi:hypothetical protein